MKKKAAEPAVPAQRGETVRRSIISALRGRALSAREISAEVGIREHEVYDHLFHVRKSLGKGECSLKVEPAECQGCGFVFRKRDRLTRPGRCPQCRGGQISEPIFSVVCMEKG